MGLGYSSSSTQHAQLHPYRKLVPVPSWKQLYNNTHHSAKQPILLQHHPIDRTFLQTIKISRPSSSAIVLKPTTFPSFRNRLREARRDDQFSDIKRALRMIRNRPNYLGVSRLVRLSF